MIGSRYRSTYGRVLAVFSIAILLSVNQIWISGKTSEFRGKRVAQLSLWCLSYCHNGITFQRDMVVRYLEHLISAAATKGPVPVPNPFPLLAD